MAPDSRSQAQEVVFGLRTGLAVFAARPSDILSIYYDSSLRGELDGLLRWAKTAGVPFREVSERELEQRAESPQHEGLCLQCKARRWHSPAELADQLVSKQGCALALDRVRNPYNIGALLRSAAFFGLDGVLLGAPAPHPALAPLATRVSEGGTEHLRLSRTTDLADTLTRLRARGIAVVGADGAATTHALGYEFKRPSVLVLGNEREGLSERVRAQCDALVAIRGTGAIESLNVAVAGAVLIAQMLRSRR